MTEVTPGPGWWQASDGEWYPPRWEYRWVHGRVYSPGSKTRPERRENDLEIVLPDLGAEGWEVVSMMGQAVTADNTAASVLLKRPLRP